MSCSAPTGPLVITTSTRGISVGSVQGNSVSLTSAQDLSFSTITATNSAQLSVSSSVTGTAISAGASGLSISAPSMTVPTYLERRIGANHWRLCAGKLHQGLRELSERSLVYNVDHRSGG